MQKVVLTHNREKELELTYRDKYITVSFSLFESNRRTLEIIDGNISSADEDEEIKMPNENTKRKQQKKSKSSASTSSEMGYDFCSETPGLDKDLLAPTDEAPRSEKRKRSPSPLLNDSDNDSDSQHAVSAIPTKSSDGSDEMKSILNSFGADVSKTLSAKRKRLAGFTSTAMKTSNKRYDDIFLQQQAQREKIVSEYGRQVGEVFHQWDSDMSKSKEADEKVEGIIRQLQKSLQQQRVVQNQRLLSLKNLHEQFIKTSRELSDIHKEQQNNIHGELRKELANLQKKMIDDARQEEMANVRKSLQTMLAQV